MERTAILICSHNKEVKNYHNAYLPIQVGASLSPMTLNMQKDNEGDNISFKNKNYCELTGHYWAWKNLPKEIKYVGLVHYRRNFYWKGHKRDYYVKHVKEDTNLFVNADVNIGNYDIILPNRCICPYSVEEQYCMGHIPEDYHILENVIKQQHTDYYSVFKEIMEGNAYSPFNMFVTSRELFNDYSNWLFSILTAVEKDVYISPYVQQARIFGYMSERLLNVYCAYKKLKVLYKPILFADGKLQKNHSQLYALCDRTRKNLSYFLGKSRNK